MTHSAELPPRRLIAARNCPGACRKTPAGLDPRGGAFWPPEWVFSGVEMPTIRVAVTAIWRASAIGIALIGLGVPVGSELDAALWIIERESGGDPTARNRRSSAHGFGQLLDGTWRGLASRAGRRMDRHNPHHQLEMFVRYVRGRYRTFARARLFHVKHGWY